MAHPVQVFATPRELGVAAAEKAAEVIRQAIAQNGRARIMVATGNSQLEVVAALKQRNDIAWKNVEVFHLDEYVGLPATHPASFRLWIKNRVEDQVHPRKMNYLEGDAADLEAEIARYAGLLHQAPIDLAFVGFGENGHIAFNDPPVADFDDPLAVKRVTLDEACRRQQAGEGHFPDLQAVPREAVTVTCSELLRVKTWVCCVPDTRKAEAVRDALGGPISTACPASIVREHPDAFVYLDSASASLLASRP